MSFDYRDCPICGQEKDPGHVCPRTSMTDMDESIVKHGIGYRLEKSPSHSRLGVWVNGANAGWLTVRNDELDLLTHLVAVLSGMGANGSELSVGGPEIPGLIGVDTSRCQADISESYSPMQFGARDVHQCHNEPAVIATEVRAGNDGRCGSMSLCPDCLLVMVEKMPNAATFSRIKDNGL